MKSVTVGEFKTNLSQLIQRILKGEEFVVTQGRKKTKVFKVLPYQEPKSKIRKLGSLEGKIKVTFNSDFEMSDDEFLKS
jgi:antitoxin (DNA-binding transcriptional repressor) of toxin-antitoxin stability system